MKHRLESLPRLGSFFLGFGILASLGSPPQAGEQAAGGQLETIEEIATQDGRLVQGVVIGYDNANKSYILRNAGGKFTLKEDLIVSIRQVRAAAPAVEKPPAAATEHAAPSPAGAAAPAEHSGAPLPEPSSSPRPEHSPAHGAAAAIRPPARGADGALLENLVRELEERLELFDPDCHPELRESLDRMAEEKYSEAETQLRRLIRSRPDCHGALLLLGGIFWSREAFPQAYRFLSLGLSADPDAPAAEALAEDACLRLGYLEAAAGLGAERIRRQSSGADRFYRLFQMQRQRSPQKALQAWREYVEEDPQLSQVDTPEGRLLDEGKKLLAAGSHSLALKKLEEAQRINPYIQELALPYRIRALEARAAAGREQWDLEAVLGDLRELQLENPPRAEEYTRTREQFEAELIARRLEGAATIAAVLEQAESLSESFPMEPERLAAAVRRRLLESAEAIIAEKTLQEAADALEAISNRGPAEEAQDVSQDRVLGMLGSRIQKDLAEGRHDTARRWLEEFSRLDPKRFEPLSAQLAAVRKAGPAGAGKAALDVDLIGPTGYFPLSAGSRWVYRHGDGTRDSHRLDKVDNQLLPPPSSHGEDERRLVYRFANQIEFGESKVAYSKCCCVEDGFLLIGTSPEPGQMDRILAAPIASGKEWSWTRGDIRYEREYLSTTATIQCRAGTFKNCLKVRATSRYQSGAKDAPAVMQLFYYAPGVGLVKIESENQLDGRELESYSIARNAEK